MLHKKFMKKNPFDTKVSYNQQRNYCVNPLRRTKKTYFANINIDLATNNKNNKQKTPKKLETCQTNFFR